MTYYGLCTCFEISSMVQFRPVNHVISDNEGLPSTVQTQTFWFTGNTSTQTLISTECTETQTAPDPLVTSSETCVWCVCSPVKQLFLSKAASHVTYLLVHAANRGASADIQQVQTTGTQIQTISQCNASTSTAAATATTRIDPDAAKH